MIEIGTPPSRCPAKRNPTLWERTKAFVFGPNYGFDIDYECNCNHYEGHEQFASSNPGMEFHEDINGKRWK